MSHQYTLIETQISKLSFLSSLTCLLDCDEISLYIDSPFQSIDRISQDGMITLLGKIHGQTIGILMNDFRINGGSFGKKISNRATAFLNDIGSKNIPAIFLFNTIGVRVMEGRTVFPDAFGIIPCLLNFRKNNFLITISIGRTLGIGALLFGLGHYRMGISQLTQLNLTGPEVIRLFFGGQFDFDQITSAENQFQSTSLIHEIMSTKEFAFKKARDLLGVNFKNFEFKKNLPFSSTILNNFEGEYIDPEFLNESEVKIKNILNQFDGTAIEVFPKLNPKVRTFIVRARA